MFLCENQIMETLDKHIRNSVAIRSGHVTGANQAIIMVECGDLLNQDYFVRQFISNSISYLTSVSSFN